jgi:hypothetical protein
MPPRTCEHCGAALDAGERCDCMNQEPEMPEALIEIRQLPVIEERLRLVKADIDERVSQALSLVCTEETIQAVKATRTDLRKQFDELEAQRRAVKTAVLAPYEQFEEVYKECVSDAFKTADAELKSKIDQTEREIKQRCEDGLREYFAELCAVNHVEWLTFEQTGVRVDMASAKQKTPKRLRDNLAFFVKAVAADADRIAGMAYADEIMVEFKRTTDAMEAIGTVTERHRRMDAERAAQAAREAQKAAEAEAVKKVEAAAPPVVMEPPAEPVLRCAFTVHGTRSQLKRLKEFLIMEGIRYE